MSADMFEFEATIDRLQEEMQSGRHTARSLVEDYLEQIHRLDRRGPSLSAVIELNPDALMTADALDRERQQNGPRSLLHGVPILIKDNIDTEDRMSTTAGSLALEGSVALKDAFLVQRLRSAGAVILGKTNLSEWANFRSDHSVSGWSARGGQTRNPYALDRNPSGSSSGSAVAVTANLCAVAVGTETDGSIVSPSAVNGVVGIKPTLGLVSRSGVVPIAHSQDTPGPIARTVRDAAILLTVLAGSDHTDRETCNVRRPGVVDYVRFLDPNGMRGMRLGVARQFFGSNARVDRLVDDCIMEMKRQGAVIIDPVNLASHKQYNDSELEVLLYEFKHDLNAYLASRGETNQVKSLAHIITFNEERRREEMPYFEQELMINAESKGPLTDAAYIQAIERNHRLSRAEGIDAVMTNENLDAIVAPTEDPAWLTDHVLGDPVSYTCATPPAVAGYPHVSVPAGFVHGLPVGISFFGRAWSEPTLLRIAYSFEQTTKARRPPRFLPTVSFSEASA